MLRAAIVSSLLLGAILTVPVLAGQSSSSFRVGLTIGQPGAWTPTFRDHRTYTWNAAAISVRRAGFHGVIHVNSSGGIYWFEAEREGRRYRVAVSASTGGILKVVTTGS